MISSSKVIKIVAILVLPILFLTSCKGGKLPGGDARKFPDDPKLRVQKNLEEGRGFRLKDSFKKSLTQEADKRRVRDLLTQPSKK